MARMSGEQTDESGNERRIRLRVSRLVPTKARVALQARPRPRASNRRPKAVTDG